MRQPLSILPVFVLVAASTAKPSEINERSDSSDRSIPLSFPDIDNNRVNTTKLVLSSDSEHLYNSVIEILEKINVLPQSCIKFEKITREVLSVEKNTGVRTIGVYLYFQESSKWRNSLDDSEKNLEGLSPLQVSNSKSDTSSKDSDLTQKVRCRSESKVVMMDAYSLTSSKGLGNKSQDGGGMDYSNTSTTVVVGARSNSGDDISDGSSQGISRTQLVVISTCSAIIGTFFLIAGIMRLRNYIKRYRQNQRQASRPTFRSCSVALRNSTPSNEQIHRDSLLSKSSSFHSNYTGRGTGTQYPASQSSRDNSRNGSPKAYADKTPLLVVTTPSDTTNTSTPTVSQVSLQYTDEDPIKSKTVKKTTTGAQDDIENRPLLNEDENHADIDIGQISDLGYVEKILNNKGPIENNKEPSKSDVASYQNIKETKACPVTKGEITHNELVNNDPTSSQADAQTVPNQQTALSPTTNDSSMLLSLDLAANGNLTLGASNFGLTQSDSSLSSMNQSYSYGNQMEYSGDSDQYAVQAGIFTYDNLNLSNQNSRPIQMPALVSFSENSFDYGRGASSMQGSVFPGRGDKSLGKRTMSLNEPHLKGDSLLFKRSMSLAEEDPNVRDKRLLKKANSLSGGGNTGGYAPPSVNSINEHEEEHNPSDKCVSSAQQNLSAQEKRELFGCGQETSVRSSGELSREPSNDARPSTPTNSISKILPREEKGTTLL